MSFYECTLGDFDEEIIRRGEAYFRRGAVKILCADDRHVSAIVSGTSSYSTAIYLDEEDDLIVSCTCPHIAATEEPCKHIWATALQAEAAGKLSDLRDLSYLDLYINPIEENPGWHHVRRSQHQHYGSAVMAPTIAPWKSGLLSIARDAQNSNPAKRLIWPSGRILSYTIVPAYTAENFDLHITAIDQKGDGAQDRSQPFTIKAELLPQVPDATDRQLLALLRADSASTNYTNSDVIQSKVTVAPFLQTLLIPMLCETGRARVVPHYNSDNPRTVTRNGDGAWRLCLEVFPSADKSAYKSAYAYRGALHRGEERIPLESPSLTIAGTYCFIEGAAAPLERTTPGWLGFCRNPRALTIGQDQIWDAVEDILSLPDAPLLSLPPELAPKIVKDPPQPSLSLAPSDPRQGNNRIPAELSFRYGSVDVEPFDERGRVFVKAERTLVHRNREDEGQAHARLVALSFRPTSTSSPQSGSYTIAPTKAFGAIRTLVEEGWRVEHEGAIFRQHGTIEFDVVSSGIDWFDLDGSADFDGQKVSIPKLLSAVKKGSPVVSLPDGSQGLIPEQWARRLGMLAGTGEHKDSRVRFSRSQVGLLDSLLAEQPDVTFDAGFEKARQEIMEFSGVTPQESPPGFRGELRPYQKEGLGWLHFLQRFGFNGCLADDMGLGKTVMVLALLEGRARSISSPPPRTTKAKGARKQVKSLPLIPEDSTPRTSLVVAPKSVVFNWVDEARVFTPGLRVLDYTGTGRRNTGHQFDDFDLVVTSYGTLRRNPEEFKDHQFDYVILDESQSIKNRKTDGAKAARLLQARHKLALSGTPIENNLGELWNLFEFLMPGLLGNATFFNRKVTSNNQPDEQTRRMLAQTLRPFILRRTKEEVAKELPPKTEQVLYCELNAQDRENYNELRDYYRASLDTRIEREGVARSTFLVIEALLRLRQAACHPGLVSPERVDETSSKLEILKEHVSEVTAEGHKALIFSQFTSLLSILRRDLDKRGVKYAYLDGKTNDRKSIVRRFERDESIKLFLIGLKAGGTGLNLTSADYVYILDPWWNPFAEAQAVDRAYRIGQTKPVFAYRLIARDTVEEKVLQLQESKKELAASIINSENSLISSLSKEDIQVLLS